MIGRARSCAMTPGRHPWLPLKRPGRWCRVGSSCHDDDRPVGTATHPDHGAGPTVATRFLEPVSHAVPGCVQRQRVQVPRHVSRTEPGVYHRRARSARAGGRGAVRPAVHPVFHVRGVSLGSVQQAFGGHWHEGGGTDDHGDRCRGAGPEQHPPAHRGRVPAEHAERLL